MSRSLFSSITTFTNLDNLQIPDKVLEHRPRREAVVRNDDDDSSSPQSRLPSDDESANYIIHDGSHKGQNGSPRPAPRPRRLSTYEDGEAVMDPESGKTRTRTSSTSESRTDSTC
jgi:hypothetical protein